MARPVLIVASVVLLIICVGPLPGKNQNRGVKSVHVSVPLALWLLIDSCAFIKKTQTLPRPEECTCHMKSADMGVTTTQGF